MSIEKPVDSKSNKQKSEEDELRVKRYIRLALFVLVLVVGWYGLELAQF